ncbi:hypothetical protein [Pseudomonas syringae]|nr:hypothetical protein [Pseudomonas syringae]
MEQELKSEFLQREALCYWGMFNESRFGDLHREFLKIDERLKVTAMDIVSISEQLVAEKVVDSTRSANTTAMYAIQWMHGQVTPPLYRGIPRPAGHSESIITSPDSESLA